MGHELPAFYSIDHARTLAILVPGHYRYNFESKKEKLAQYSERIWNIKEGTVEENAKAGIEKKEEFFHSLGIDTKLSDYTKEYADTGSIVSKRFTERGGAGLVEHKSLSPSDAKKIIEMSY